MQSLLSILNVTMATKENAALGYISVPGIVTSLQLGCNSVIGGVTRYFEAELEAFSRTQRRGNAGGGRQVQPGV